MTSPRRNLVEACLLRSGFPLTGPHAGRTPAGHPCGRFFAHKAFQMTKAETYRKRAKALGKRMGSRQVQHTTPVGRKQKALTDMADNEDWLDGKTKARGDKASRKLLPL